MSNGGGPWCRTAKPSAFTSPGVLIVGFIGVSTGAVGTTVMGYADPRTVRGAKPFASYGKHLLPAEQGGLGTAGLSRIDLRGAPLEKACAPHNIWSGFWSSVAEKPAEACAGMGA